MVDEIMDNPVINPYTPRKISKNTMNSTIDNIKSRTSWRTYSKQKLNKTDRAKLEEFIQRDIKTPFGARPRFTIIDYESGEQQLGTYGFIKDAQHFIAGAVKPAPMGYEDYGYALENIILYATELGLGTCWLGGTFNRQGFTEAIGLLDDEKMPAVTPIGYKAERRGIEKIMRWAASSRNRKSWNQIFFDNTGSPLTPEKAGIYERGFEMVRLAPSASNGQPWMLILDEDTIHFYHKGKTGYDVYRQMDLGIAFSHFELTTNKQDIIGEWSREDPEIDTDKSRYVASWSKTN